MKRYSTYISKIYNKINESTNDKESLEYAKNELLKQNYIVMDKNDNLLYIYTYPFNTKSLNTTNVERRKLTYSTLVRHLLYNWLKNYKGDNEKLLYVKNNFGDDNDLHVIAFKNIPTNRNILYTFFKPEVSSASLYTNSTDYIFLYEILTKKDVIFTEENILKWFDVVSNIAKKSDNGEKKVIDFIKKQGIFNDVEKSDMKDDKNGIDIWLINKNGKKIPAQIKTIYGNSSIKYTPHKILIQNAKLDFGIIKKITTNLQKNTVRIGKNEINENFKWDYLFLLDDNKNIIYQIHKLCINSIYEHLVDNYIYINLEEDEMLLNCLFKIYKIS